jgi:hypothetical protein
MNRLTRRHGSWIAALPFALAPGCAFAPVDGRADLNAHELEERAPMSGTMPLDEPLDPCAVPFGFDERGHPRSIPADCEAGSVAPWDPVELEGDARRGRPDDLDAAQKVVGDDGVRLEDGPVRQRP